MSLPRTSLAALLTTVAFAVPSVAWYVAGSRQLEREAAHELERIKGGAETAIERLTGRLEEAFEGLLESESRRPFYHYQNLYHDPRGASEGPSVTLSPLAEGTAHPLVEAHFQVNEDGRLTLPTLNDELPELGLQELAPAQCALLDDLVDVAIFASDPYAVAVLGDEGPPPAVESLAAGAWQQHLKANALYADLKYKKRTELGWEASEGRVEIGVGRFSWHTLPVGGSPALVALRPVTTPEGLWTQGFVISSAAVEASLGHGDWPAVFAPSSGAGEAASAQNKVEIEIEGSRWGLSRDLSPSINEAIQNAAVARQRFVRWFSLCALAAGLAGLLVVSMVWQSERLAAQRAQFAAHAAHELRTPLAGLRLYSEMLAEGLGDPQKSRVYARRLAGESERLGRVVSNVLSFTRLERKSLKLDLRRGDLKSAVEEAFRRQRPALEEAGANVELDLAGELPAARFDPDALGHILQNLLDNAEKYTRGIEGREIRVRLGATAKAVALSVADNGRGISKQLRRRLFRPFTRGEHSDAPEGVGLGLVLVRSLALAQGGDVTYSDAPSGGAVFTVTFPR